MTWYKNPYVALLLIPLIAFMFMMYLRVDPDNINLIARLYVFALFGYVGARYVGRAPSLMWHANITPEARNVTGWALVCIGSMMQMVYGFLYIVYERPEWLSSQYWSSSFVVLVGVGLTLVASSVPKLPPFGGGANGLSVIASFTIGFSSAMGLFFLGHIVQIFTVVKSAFFSVMHAL